MNRNLVVSMERIIDLLCDVALRVARKLAAWCPKGGDDLEAALPLAEVLANRLPLFRDRDDRSAASRVDECGPQVKPVGQSRKNEKSECSGKPKPSLHGAP